MFTVTPSQARNGLAYAEPTILAMLASSLTKRPDLHVRIAFRDSGLPDGFTTLYEESYGVRHDWKFRYDEVTYDKTRKTFKNGFTSRELHQMLPQFLDPEDGEFWGTAMRGNLVVSCSGVQPEFDEAFANIIIAIIFADVQLHYKALMERREAAR